MLTLQIESSSPVCLVKTHIGQCNHHWCMMAHKNPQYFGFGIEDFYGRFKFTEFEVIPGLLCDPFLIPHTFSSFRQSMSAIINLGGDWPADLKIVSRDHVEIRWVEQNETYLQYNEATGKNESLSRLDVRQLAFYIGPNI